ncbi:DUF58 domain-containing protein [Paenibacillus sp. 1011MAR3C5]|uniref:DUF58 domain-containing protein n=1 Tax=Paenibacillus sp. 1011MAR3C5 TaxID=1675787 RepID=UPI000E6CBB43|nr:DUF58 domain-containing protein [Paenibacillus sp. 1011MAR3C5]RJE88658.1 DUF58 domain-containing protein [Paenibacillus sp. 1011MAR3C5]
MTGRSRYRTRWAAWSILFAGLLCAGVAAVVRGGAVEWFIFALLGGIGAVSVGLPIAASKSMNIKRIVSETEIEAGESVQITLSIERKWRIPMVWIAIEESVRNTSSLNDRPAPYRTVLAQMFGGSAAVNYSLNELARGVHRFGPVTVTCGDLFGLTAVRREVNGETEFVVLPTLPENDASNPFQLTGRRQPDISAYTVSSSLSGEGTDAYAGLFGKAGLGPDSRPYREGDSLRHLDFRAAARGRGLYTKLHDGDESRSERFVWIDQLASPYGNDSRLFDACISWTLLDVQRSSEAGSSVMLYADEWTCHLSGASDSEQMARLSELKHMLARVTPSDTQKEWPGLAELRDERHRSDRMLTVYSADWHNAGRWLKLADQAGECGFGLELHGVTRSAVPSFAMRETGRLLEASGIHCYWLHVTQSKEAWTSAGKGEDAYALG